MIVPEIGVITNVILNLSDLKPHEIQREVGEALKAHSLHTVPTKMDTEPFFQTHTEGDSVVNIHLRFDKMERHFDVVAIQPDFGLYS